MRMPGMTWTAASRMQSKEWFVTLGLGASYRVQRIALVCLSSCSAVIAHLERRGPKAVWGRLWRPGLERGKSPQSAFVCDASLVIVSTKCKGDLTEQEAA